MNTTYLRSPFRYALLGMLVLAGLKEAQALPVCSTGSLASYMALDSSGGCTTDDLTFFRFSYNPAPVSTGGAPVASASDIMVTPISNSVGIGFSYSSSFFNVSSGEGVASATYNIGYSVDPPPVIVAEGLSLDPPFGNVLVSQQLCLNDVLANACAFGIQESHAVTPAVPLSYVTFPSPVPFVDVQTTISLTATPGNPAGFDALETGSLLASPVPEPSTAALGMITALIGAAGYRLKNRKPAYSNWDGASSD